MSVIALLIVECIAFVCIKYSNDSGSDFHVHRYAYTQIRPQTCNQNGEKKGKCICGDVVIIETPKLQHSFKDNICGLCEINYFDTCDHEWNTTVCTEVKTCLNCGLINIDDLQHSFVDNACQFCYLQATSNEYFAFTKHGSNYSVKPKNKQDLPSNIVLPSTYNNRPVDLIETEAFLDCDKIVSLVIPQSIKTIKADAFKDCNNLSVYYNGHKIPPQASKVFSKFPVYIKDTSGNWVQVKKTLFGGWKPVK